jgi:hypothetical protein
MHSRYSRTRRRKQAASPDQLELPLPPIQLELPFEPEPSKRIDLVFFEDFTAELITKFSKPKPNVNRHSRHLKGKNNV